MRAPGDGQGGAAVEGLEEICMVGAVQGEATVPGIGQLMLYLMVFMAVSWSLMYFIPTTLLFTVMLPASFYVLFSLVVFSPLISGGWPFAPPLGSWKPGQSFWRPGIGTTILLLAFAIAGPIFTTHVYPEVSSFPCGVLVGHHSFHRNPLV